MKVFRTANTPVSSYGRSRWTRIRHSLRSAFAMIFCLFSSQAFAQSQARVEIVFQFEHREEILSVAFSPSGKLTASASRDGTLKLWDARSGRLLRTFFGGVSTSEITSVVFSPDGKKILAAGFGEGTFASLYDVESGQLIRSFASQVGREYTTIAFFPDGKRFASAFKDGSLQVFNAEVVDVLQTFRGDKGHTGVATSVAISPDGKLVASGGIDGYVKIWDVSTGQLLKSLSEDAGAISSVTFSPGGRELVASRIDQTIVVFDVRSGRQLRTFSGHEGRVTSAAFSRDGKLIASGSDDGTIRLWDAEGRDMRALSIFRTNAGRINSVVFSPDGRRILAGSKETTMSLWDIDTGHRLLSVVGDVAEEINSVAFSPNGQKFALGRHDGTISAWETNSGRNNYLSKSETGEPVVALAYSRDGRTIAIGRDSRAGGTIKPNIKLLNAESGREVRKFTDSNPNYVSSLAYSLDGSKIISAGYGVDQTVKVWNVANGKLVQMIGRFKRQVTSVALSPDGKNIASLYADSTIKIWDLAKETEIASLQNGGAGEWVGNSALAYVPDGRRLASVGERGITIWEVESGREAKILRLENGAFPICLAIHPNGNWIIAGNVDSTLTIWDSTKGNQIRSLEGHADMVTSLALSADGKKLISGSRDATAKVWDVQNGELLGTATSFSNGEWIFMTPEGFFDASANGAKYLNVARNLEASSIDQFYDALHRPDLVQQKLAGDPQGLVKAAAARLDLNKVASSGGSPSVKITAVPTSVSDAQVVIEATVSDQGGGIGRIEWRNNKKALEIDAAISAASVEKGKTVAVRKTVPLVVGENVIEIKAYNGPNLIESESVQVTVTRTKQPQAKITRPQLYVLAVGVNDYWDTKLHLNFAVPDAISMSEALQQAGGKLYERVNITTVLNADVSAANLDRIFADLKRNVKAEDVFVFFLSGHGKTEDGKFYYIPQDFRYNGAQSIVQNAISHDKLKGWLGQILAQKSVLLFDACESGALIQGQIAMRGLEDKTALDHLVRATGATVLTATTDDKPAAEGYYGHGVFTYALLSAFANADANGDGFIDVQELASYVFAKVPALTDAAWGIKQSPQFNVVGSIYPLVAKTSLLPAAVASPAAAIPAVSTHVVIAASTVRQSASAASGAVIELKPGTQVRLMEVSGGWILVARDGKKLGYIDAKSVAGLQ